MESTVPDSDEEVSIPSFERWLKIARKGQKFTYHIGHLAGDREDVVVMTNYSSPVHIYYEPMNTLGHMAYQAYEQGKVTLVQKKIGPGRYEYMAFKRK